MTTSCVLSISGNDSGGSSHIPEGANVALPDLDACPDPAFELIRRALAGNKRAKRKLVERLTPIVRFQSSTVLCRHGATVEGWCR